LEQQLEKPASALFFEPASPASETSDPPFVAISLEKAESFAWPTDTGIQIIRATCAWIQYGTVGFAAFCIVIGALEGLFGR
jgi:hypothetical protein